MWIDNWQSFNLSPWTCFYDVLAIGKTSFEHFVSFCKTTIWDLIIAFFESPFLNYASQLNCSIHTLVFYIILKIFLNRKTLTKKSRLRKKLRLCRQLLTHQRFASPAGFRLASLISLLSPHLPAFSSCFL